MWKEQCNNAIILLRVKLPLVCGKLLLSHKTGATSTLRMQTNFCGVSVSFWFLSCFQSFPRRLCKNRLSPGLAVFLTLCFVSPCATVNATPDVFKLPCSRFSRGKSFVKCVVAQVTAVFCYLQAFPLSPGLHGLDKYLFSSDLLGTTSPASHLQSVPWSRAELMVALSVSWLFSGFSCSLLLFTPLCHACRQCFAWGEGTVSAAWLQRPLWPGVKKDVKWTITSEAFAESKLFLPHFVAQNKFSTSWLYYNEFLPF